MWGCCLGVLFWTSWEGNGEENPAKAPVPPGLAQNVLECCKGSRWGELKEAFLWPDQEVCSFLPGFGSEGPG